MKKTLPFLLLFASTAAFAIERGEMDERQFLRANDYPAAIVKYSVVAKDSPHAAEVAEYAYALALSGLPEAALVQLDRALIMDADDEEVLFYTSAVFAALGLEAAARELARPKPEWLKGMGPLPRLELARREADFRAELDGADLLMGQKRYAEAALRFHVLTLTNPDQSLAWSGLAIALEKLGAYRAAALAVAKDLELNSQDEEMSKTIRDYQVDLESRPSLREQKEASQGLKGRYLSFFGASYTKSAGDSLINVNTRFGKFFTNRFDAAVNFGYVSGYSNTQYDGASVGVSGRFNTPLPGAPLNGTLGARVAYNPGPADNVSFMVSPGLSFFVPGGSFDLYADIALTGVAAWSKTWSFGYTAYFGGAKI